MLTDTPASNPSLSPSVPPSLSPSDTHRLNILFENDLNIFALGREESLSGMQFLTWTERPEIKERIEQMKALRKLAVESAQDSARLIAIDTLKELARNAKDPTDRRRAASTLMRNLDCLPRSKQVRRALHPPTPGEVPPTGGAAWEGAPSLHTPTSSTSSAPSPSASPPPRPSSAPTATTIANILLHSGTTRGALEVLHRHMALTGATIFGAPAPPHISRFVDAFSTGPLAGFISTVPRDLTPSLVTSDDTGDSYHLGALSFHLHHNGIGWGITTIDTT